MGLVGPPPGHKWISGGQKWFLVARNWICGGHKCGKKRPTPHENVGCNENQPESHENICFCNENQLMLMRT